MLLEPEQLIPHLHDENLNIRAHALDAVVRLIQDRPDTTPLIRGNILSPVVAMLSRREEVERVAFLIGRLADDPANHQAVLTSGALKELTATFAHEPVTQVMIALYKSMRSLPEARAIVADHGAVPLLLNLLEDSSSKRGLACEMLRLLSEDKPHRERLIAAGAVQTLFRLLVPYNESDELIVFLQLLESLSRDGLNSTMMAETDWVGTMITVLSHEEPKECMLAARFVYNVTTSNDSPQKERGVSLIEGGAVAQMTKLLGICGNCQQSDKAELALAILHGMNNMAQCQDLNDALAVAGCAISVSKCLAAVHPSSLDDASSLPSKIRMVASEFLVFQILSSVKTCSDVGAKWQEAVLPLLSSSSACECCKNGLKILLQLISSDEGNFWLQLIRSDALSVIVTTLASSIAAIGVTKDNHESVCLSIQLLLSVSAHEEALPPLVEAGCLPPLAVILKRRNKTDYLVREQECGVADLGNILEGSALRLLGNLSLCQENGNAIFTSGVVWEVIRLHARKGSTNKEAIVASINYLVHNKDILSGIRSYCPSSTTETDPRVQQKEWLQRALEAWERD